jgi:diguanylate cyclase (GGDEF)-like protein
MEVATIYFAGVLVGAVVAGAIWFGIGPAGRYSGLRSLALASLALSAALALHGLRGMIPDWISQGGGNTLLIGAALLYRFAVDHLFERDAWTRAPFAVAGAAALAVWGSIVGDAPEVARAVTGSVAVAAALALPAWALLTGTESWRGRSRHIAGGVFVLGAMLAFARAMAVATGAAPVSLVAGTMLNQALALIVIVLLATVSFAFLALLREREQARFAMLDPLTGVLNRRAFEEHAGAALALARRRDLTCCVAIVEIDEFGRINEAHGNAGGDQVLRHCADLLRRVLRREDVLGRYGGDEFAMLFFATPATGGQAVAQRIATALAANPARIRQLGVPVTASFGIAEWLHGSALGLDELLQQADRACQAAKARGRNCSVSYDEIKPGEADYR